MDAARDLGGASALDPASAILERLDGIGRLLAQGTATPASPSRPSGTDAHLVTRIDMLGRIVEQVLADREEAEATLAALTRRLVDLEGRLAPALETCAERLAEAVPLLAEAALDRLPGGGVALRVALREVRDAVAALDRRIGVAHPLPPSATSLHDPNPAASAPSMAFAEPRRLAAVTRARPVEASAHPSSGTGTDEPARDGPLILTGALPSRPLSSQRVDGAAQRPAEAVPAVVATRSEGSAPGADGDAILQRLLSLSQQDGGSLSGPDPGEDDAPLA